MPKIAAYDKVLAVSDRYSGHDRCNSRLVNVVEAVTNPKNRQNPSVDFSIPHQNTLIGIFADLPLQSLFCFSIDCPIMAVLLQRLHIKVGILLRDSGRQMGSSLFEAILGALGTCLHMVDGLQIFGRIGHLE